MDEGMCLTKFLAAVLSCVFFMFLYLFSSFFYKVTQESFGNTDLSEPPDGLQRPLIITIFCATFLSIATYVLFMLGIFRLNTRLMLPWVLVIGVKCIAGGVLLIYVSFYVSSWDLLEGVFYLLATVISFVCICCCYHRVNNIKKLSADRRPTVNQLSIISLTNEKPKTII